MIEIVYQKIRKIEYKSEIFNLHDGGTCLLDWYSNKKIGSTVRHQRENPLLIIVPGLTGNSSNLYITSVIVECER